MVEHKDEKMYVPALIFGHLLTSSNYDDDEKKVTGEDGGSPGDPQGSPGDPRGQRSWCAVLTGCSTSGGRNGYGAKLCNIFSTKFTVETACKEYRHSFKQVSPPLSGALFLWQRTSTKSSSSRPEVLELLGGLLEGPVRAAVSSSGS